MESSADGGYASPGKELASVSWLPWRTRSKRKQSSSGAGLVLSILEEREGPRHEPPCQAGTGAPRRRHGAGGGTPLGPRSLRKCG